MRSQEAAASARAPSCHRGAASLRLVVTYQDAERPNSTCDRRGEWAPGRRCACARSIARATSAGVDERRTQQTVVDDDQHDELLDTKLGIGRGDLGHGSLVAAVALPCSDDGAGVIGEDRFDRTNGRRRELTDRSGPGRLRSTAVARWGSSPVRVASGASIRMAGEPNGGQTRRSPTPRWSSPVTARTRRSEPPSDPIPPPGCARNRL